MFEMSRESNKQLTMNYELAKKLKDAGFPQEAGSPILVCTGFSEENGFESKDVTIKYPTLSELIEACGGKFKSLEVFAGEKYKWVATKRNEFGIKKEEIINIGAAFG